MSSKNRVNAKSYCALAFTKSLSTDEEDLKEQIRYKTILSYNRLILSENQVFFKKVANTG